MATTLAFIDSIIQKLLTQVPRNKWGEFLDSHDLDHVELQEIEVRASAHSVILAEISEYAGYRGAYGCGDHGHEKAVEAAKKKRKKVRKAIGYTYP